jgi:predicted ATPase
LSGELAPLSDPDQIALAGAAVFRLQEEHERGFRAVLLDALARRQLVIVLDNCEHLIEACAVLAHDVLRSCPSVSILATSRQPLGIDGEVTRRVPMTRPTRSRTTASARRHVSSRRRSSHGSSKG